jgi:hypothetical protein
MADSPTLVTVRDRVFVGHASARAVCVDADSFGSGAYLIVDELGENDIRDVVTDRIQLAHRECCVPKCRQPFN